jgi:acyl carrier protein
MDQHANDKQTKIREMISSIVGKPVNAATDENLFDCGVMDSFALTDLVSALEKEYSIHIPDGDLNPRKFASIERIEQYLNSRV